MTKLEQLADNAKLAQRAYDKELRNDKAKELKEGTIVVTSTKEGCEFNCNADGDLVVQHCIATVQHSLTMLDKQKDLDNLMLLVISIMGEMKDLAALKSKEL